MHFFLIYQMFFRRGRKATVQDIRPFGSLLNVVFGGIFGALERKTAAELLLQRFSVEVSGLEPLSKRPARWLSTRLSVLWFL